MLRTHLLAYISALAPVPLLVAVRKGWLADAGLSVRLSSEMGWSSLQRHLLERKVAGAVVPITYPLMLPQDTVYGPLPLRACRITAFHGFTALVGRRLSQQMAEGNFSEAIRLAVPGDCAPCNTLLRHWLRQSRWSHWLERLVEVPVSVLEMNMYLEDEEVDLICTCEPWSTLAERRGIGQSLCSGLDLYPLAPSGIFVYNPELVGDPAKFEEQIAAALSRAAEWSGDPANAFELSGLLMEEGWGLSGDDLKSIIRAPGAGYPQNSSFIALRLPGRDNNIHAADVAFALRFCEHRSHEAGEREVILRNARMAFGDNLTEAALKIEQKTG